MFLFPGIEPKHLRRRHDPSTSQEGADFAVTQYSKTAKFALDCIARTPGLTQAELAAVHKTKDSRKIGRMCGVLASAGLAHRGPKRKDKHTNITAFTWWPGPDPKKGKHDEDPVRNPVCDDGNGVRLAREG